jgi:4-hydroxybenzoate polyprenyltransferase
LPDPWLLFLFAVGALLMRAAGCTVNDIADRDFDRQVARTALRPLAAGAISRRQATIFLIALLLIAFLVLLQFNLPTILLGMASLPLVALYPFAKRFTYWPQLMLGLTFNWGALVGWMAVHGELSAPAYLLYIAGIAWTLGYDTIYAHQDKEDDALIGVKSTALLFGNRTKTWLSVFYSIAFLCFGGAFFLAGLNGLAWLGLAVVAGHFAWQIFSLDINVPKKCLLLFKRNRDAGIVIFIAIVLGSIGG